MKVYSISDLHLSGAKDKPMNIFGDKWEGYWDKIITDWNDKISKEDVVLIAGDISWAMKLDDAKIDLEAISELKGHKVIIRGNHDYWWSSIGKVREALHSNMYAIQNDCLRIDNLLVCGSRGWDNESRFVDENDKKIYTRELLRMEMSLQDMAKKRKEDDIVVGMIHYPPYNPEYSPSGLTELFTKYNVPQVVYGHIHAPYHVQKPRVKIDEVEYILTSCDLIGNKLIRIV